jgi:vacuolar-type H+-ATPase subunit I/STV1
MKRERTAEEKAKISKGLKEFWNKKGRKDNKAWEKGYNVGSGVTGVSGLVGLTAYGARNLEKDKPDIARAVDSLSLKKNKQTTISTVKDLESFIKNSKSAQKKTQDQIRQNLENLYSGKQNSGKNLRQLDRKLKIQKLLNSAGKQAKRSPVSLGYGIEKFGTGKSLALLGGLTVAGGVIGGEIARRKRRK